MKYILLILLFASCSAEQQLTCECQDQRTDQPTQEINYYEVVPMNKCDKWTFGDSLVFVENNVYAHRFKKVCK